MTAPVRRRPLPALALIGVLTVLTAFVWFRVIHRGDSDTSGAGGCPLPSTSASSGSASRSTPTARPTVLPYPQQVAVVLLNSTHRNGLAKQTRKVLRKRGFKITATDNDGRKYGGGGVIQSGGEIRYGKRSLAAATLLSYYLPHSQLRLTKSASSVVIVSLGRRFTTLASAATVKKELQHAGAKLRRTPASPTASPSPSPSSC